MGISCIRPRLRVVLEILYTVHSTVQMIKLSGSGKQPTSHKMDQGKTKILYHDDDDFFCRGSDKRAWSERSGEQL